MDFMRRHLLRKKGRQGQGDDEEHKYGSIGQRASTEENHLTDLVLGRHNDDEGGFQSHLNSSSDLIQLR